jgi:1,4-alpha-glucan branching enzyme
MEPIGGVWKKVVKLPPGRYRYRYVIDGHWKSDPLNAEVEPSPYGGDDSILIVDESDAARTHEASVYTESSSD